MDATIIQITDIQAFVSLVVFVATIGIAWGALKTSVKNLNTSFDELKPDLKDIRERFMVVEDRVDTLWKDKVAPAGSPRKLNARGMDILDGSGIKKIIDEKKDQLLEVIKAKNLTNPYDAEQSVLQAVTDLQKDTVLIEDLKKGAFSVGADIDTVLLVGGIYLRDLIFPSLGFSIDDLDKPQP